MYNVEYILKIGEREGADQIVQVTLTDYMGSPECAVLRAESYNEELARLYHQDNPKMVDGMLCWATPVSMIVRSVPFFDEIAAWALYKGLVKEIQKETGRGLEHCFEPTHVAFSDDGRQWELEAVPQWKAEDEYLTRDEWRTNADMPGRFQLLHKGWTLDGEPFAGKVVPIKEAAREAAIKGLKT